MDIKYCYTQHLIFKVCENWKVHLHSSYLSMWSVGSSKKSDALSPAKKVMRWLQQTKWCVGFSKIKWNIGSTQKKWCAGSSKKVKRLLLQKKWSVGSSIKKLQEVPAPQHWKVLRIYILEWSDFRKNLGHMSCCSRLFWDPKSIILHWSVAFSLCAWPHKASENP